jgi:dTDP-glucose pyrophosphorylase
LHERAIRANLGDKQGQLQRVDMINIVIPMAGEGARFVAAGFTRPKPLIPVDDVPMIELVVRNVAPRCDHRFVFICQAAHVERFRLREFLDRIAPGCGVIELGGTTQGAACSVLTAKALIGGDAPLVIANSDQYIDGGAEDFLEEWLSGDLDGSIMTMFSRDPKWSFAALGPTGLVTRVAEKEPISDQATVGIYAFRRGQDFIDGAEEMIAKNRRVNGEFYVAPVYNELIGKGQRIGIYNIGPVGDRMHGLGTPDDLAAYQSRHQASRQAG